MAYDDEGVIRSYIRASADWFYDQGVELEVSCDFKKFYDAIRRLDGGYGENLNPAYDYRYNRLDWSNALWIHAVDHTGKIVGQVAAKLVADEPNLFEAYRKERFWYANRRAVETCAVEMLSPATKSVSGLISTSGSIWVHRERRKTGMSGRLATLARAMMLKEHGSNFHTGMVKQALFEAGMMNVYQHVHSDLSLRLLDVGYSMHSLWVTRSEAITLFRSALARREKNERAPASSDLG